MGGENSPKKVIDGIMKITKKTKMLFTIFLEIKKR